ncbi:MAG: transposase [Anaerolineales bacterium]|nr:transposase [Anaerolineales bacterium]MCZ7550772.1 transposase [Anaerolineales bacterium]
MFGGVLWQRCQYHLQQNATSHVPRREMLTEVARTFAECSMPRPSDGRSLLEANGSKVCSKRFPPGGLDGNQPARRTDRVRLSRSAPQKLRTNNTQERLNREIGRRTNVVSIFPNEAACLRLVSAILMEQDEEWQMGRVYLSMDENPPPK